VAIGLFTAGTMYNPLELSDFLLFTAATRRLPSSEDFRWRLITGGLLFFIFESLFS